MDINVLKVIDRAEIRSGHYQLVGIVRFEGERHCVSVGLRKPVKHQVPNKERADRNSHIGIAILQCENLSVSVEEINPKVFHFGKHLKSGNNILRIAPQGKRHLYWIDSHNGLNSVPRFVSPSKGLFIPSLRSRGFDIGSDNEFRHIYCRKESRPRSLVLDGIKGRKLIADSLKGNLLHLPIINLAVEVRDCRNGLWTNISHSDVVLVMQGILASMIPSILNPANGDIKN